MDLTEFDWFLPKFW